MSNMFDELLDATPRASDGPELALVLEPGETVVWTGRSRPIELRRRTIRLGIHGAVFGLLGLLIVVFLIQIPGIYVACAPALWIFLSLLPGLARALREIYEWNRTLYVLTDRRALIIAPRLTGGVRPRAFTPVLADLIRCRKGFADWGDLAFVGREHATGKLRYVHFLDVAYVLEVETLLRSVVHRVEPRPQVWRATLRARYHHGARFVVASVGLLMLAIATIGLLAVLAVLIIRWSAGDALPGGFGGSVALVGGFATAAMLLLPSALAKRRECASVASEIELGDDHTATFRNGRQSQSISAAEVLSIEAPLASDAFSLGSIHHKHGVVFLSACFPGFLEFVAAIKAINPSIELGGIQIPEAPL